jgi:hypothetical protein
MGGGEGRCGGTASALIQIESKEAEMWTLTASMKNPKALKMV